MYDYCYCLLMYVYTYKSYQDSRPITPLCLECTNTKKNNFYEK